ITLPGVALSSVFFSTDLILLFFIAIALLAYFGPTTPNWAEKNSSPRRTLIPSSIQWAISCVCRTVVLS
ncbi:hypothetical protein ACC839_38875, partial [Rhizobium ruizarguesonis]